MAPSSTDHKFGAATEPSPSIARCFRMRVVLVVRGLVLLLKLLALAPSLLPLEQFQHLPIPLQQLLASTHALTTQTQQAAPQGITPFTTVAPVETPVFRTNVMRLWLAGVSDDSPWSLPRVSQAFPAFKDTKLSFSHLLWKNVQCSWSQFLLCVTENVINPLLLRHLRSLILHCHGKNIFGK